MNEIQPFANDEFDLEFIPDGDAFKVAAPGLARALGFREAYDLLRTIPDDEKGSELVRTLGGEQRVLVLTEPGFYRALGQRQSARITDKQVREQVERFQSWVYREVLPSIRKTGGYSVAGGAPSVPVQIQVAVNRLAELAHDEHVVPAAARILAFKRWRKPRKGIEVYVQLAIDVGSLGLDGAPVEARALRGMDRAR